jgi:hypothetical protein
MTILSAFSNFFNYMTDLHNLVWTLYQWHLPQHIICY